MNRRDFIVGASSVGATLALTTASGAAYKAAARDDRKMVWHPDMISIDEFNMKIGLGRKMTVLEMHRALQDIFDHPNMMIFVNPTIRLTDHIIEMVNGWTLEEDSFDKLSEGLFTQTVNDEKETYYSYVSIGTTPNVA